MAYCVCFLSLLFDVVSAFSSIPLHRRLADAAADKLRLDTNGDGYIQESECKCGLEEDLFTPPTITRDDVDYNALKRFEAIAKTMAAAVSAVDGQMPPADELAFLKNTMWQDPASILGVWYGFMPDAYDTSFGRNFDMTDSVKRVSFKGCANQGACDYTKEHPQHNLTEWYFPQLGRNATLHFPYVYAKGCCSPVTYGDYLGTVEWAWLWNYVSTDREGFGFFTEPLEQYLLSMNGNVTFLEAGQWGAPFIDPVAGVMVSYVLPFVTRKPIAGSVDPFVVEKTGKASTGPIKSWEGLYVLGAAGLDIRLNDIVLNCPPGEYSDYPVCKPCIPGTYRTKDDSAEKCIPCAAGTYNNVSSATTCSRCDAGSFSKSLGQTACNTCAVGSAAFERGMNECEECAAGFFSETLGATECTKCSIGSWTSDTKSSMCTACGPKLTTLQLAEVNGQFQIVLFQGATSVGDCGCEPGTKTEGGACAECVEGLDCRGADEIWVKPGYYSEAEISIYKCHGDSIRCKGGRPGDTCNLHRIGTSCAECEAGTTAASDGTCEACEGPDTAVFVVVVLACVLILVLVYWVIDTKDHTKQSHAVLLCVMAVSITVTITQQIGIIGLFAMEWPEPIASLLNVVRFLNFDIEILRLSCVASTGAFGRFAAKVGIVAVGIIFLIVIHALSVMLLYRGDFSARKPSIIAALGTLFMVFYISLVSTVLAPLQCLSNPNGKWTSRGYQSVTCWTSEGDHTGMVVLGLIVLLVPVGYLVHCTLTVKHLPLAMRRGETSFLRAYTYLFFRYRVEVYWYSLVHMFRSLILSLSSIIPDVIVQIVVVQIVTVAHLASTIYLEPWRVWLANVLEVVFSIGILLILTAAAVFVEQEDLSPVAWFGVVVILVILCCLPAFLSIGLIRYFRQRSEKAFQFFICHHKAGAGCFARMLKIAMSKEKRVTKNVFIDCDDLRSLDKLFDNVATETDNFVIVCSKEVLGRQWCMGEIVTAHINNVHTKKVSLPDYQEPTPEFIQFYGDIVDMTGLPEHGISLAMVREALTWVSKQAEIKVGNFLSEATLMSLTTKLMQGGEQTTSTEIPFAADTLDDKAVNAILVDHSCFEAQSTAFVLKHYLTKAMGHSVEEIPFVLKNGMMVPSSVKIMLILCTQGSFQQVNFLKSLMSAAQLEVKFLPILGDESFRFPTPEFTEVNGRMISSITEHPQELVALILSVFKSIAVVFQPAQYSSTEQILVAKAQQAFERITERGSGNSLQKLRFAKKSEEQSKEQKEEESEEESKVIDYWC